MRRVVGKEDTGKRGRTNNKYKEIYPSFYLATYPAYFSVILFCDVVYYNLRKEREISLSIVKEITLNMCKIEEESREYNAALVYIIYM